MKSHSLLRNNSLRYGFKNFSQSLASYSKRTSDHLVPKIEESPRLKDLRSKLKNDDASDPLIKKPHIFKISSFGKRFLERVNEDFNKKYSRGGAFGEGYVGLESVLKKIQSLDSGLIDEKKSETLLQLSSKIQKRMRVKISESYLQHALNIPKNAKEPNPILKVVIPDTDEVSDLAGEIDPSNQNRYSPLPGLLHKYEMLLAFVSINCSSHCRYCYRLDLFSGTSNKSKADMPVIAAYIKTFNELLDNAIKENGRWDKRTGLWYHKENDEPLVHIREILFSGGDVMTLPNATIARYMTLMAEAGVQSIRFGTKDLVFHPQRFDNDFWEMMDLFHANYPDVKIDFVGHYVHPYELVDAKTDVNGSYIYDVNSNYKTRLDLKPVLKEIGKRGEWIEHSNQFPIIAGINDSPDIIRLLLRQCRRLGISVHNVYACREIVGNKHFREDNTIQKQYDLVEEGKIGLSGLENHARLIMSTEYGKIEVVGGGEGFVLLRLNRFVGEKRPKNTTIKIDLTKLENNQFYWLTDEVISQAASKEDQETLADIKNETNSFIKELKKIAAQSVLDQTILDQIPQDQSKTKQKDNVVVIEILNRNGGSNFINVDLDKLEKKEITLASVLKEAKEVEAACEEKLSCSTCVGEVTSDNPDLLPKATEDELDLVDSVAKDVPESENLRATCAIPLKPGKYKFKSLKDAKEEKEGSSR